MNNKKYHYFYKITNLINGKYYYGIHSTNNLNDGYMGSGAYLHKAYKKYGIENFYKEILKYFDNRNELVKYEEEIVNEMVVKDNQSYNISIGGETFNTLYTISVKDKNGNTFRCKLDDPKYISSEYVGVCKGLVNIIDIRDNSEHKITKDKLLLNPNYKPQTKGKIRVIDENQNEKFITLDEFYNNKSKYQAWAKNKILVKDKSGKCFMVNINDERYISGELKSVWFGKHHTEESKQKLKETYKKIKHQQGEKNSQYGTCWIHNNKESKKIKKEYVNEYLKSGWVIGRKMKFD